MFWMGDTGTLISDEIQPKSRKERMKEIGDDIETLALPKGSKKFPVGHDGSSGAIGTNSSAGEVQMCDYLQGTEDSGNHINSVIEMNGRNWD
jgi:hypothetical protein